MCGIAGVAAARAGAEEIARAMAGLLGHRGPDASGITEVSGTVLAHRRLSIIDLSHDADQPMWDAQRRACISYNGEIYNYRELREECVRRGATFRTQSDTEVILALFLLDGESAFSRLNGMFAFCLTDAQSGDSWLVRDPAGIKPLYWSQTDRGIVFASELSAMLEARAVPFDVDRAALQAYAQLDFTPSPMSMVRGVRKVSGGEFVHVTRDGAVAERAYASLPAEESAVTTSDAGDVDRFDALIRTVVARQLVADVPVGVFLSGGIDSSIVARVAMDLAGRLSTFSIAFDDPSFDERVWFEKAARSIGSTHHVELFDARSMLDLLPRMPRVLGEPLADGSIFPTMLLSRFASRSVKVALSGDGADELFAGYPTHRVIRAGRVFASMPAIVRRSMSAAAHALLPVSPANLSLEFRIKKFLDGAHRDPVAQNERWLGSFAAEELPALLTSWSPDAQERLVEQWHAPSQGARTPLEAVLRTDRRFYLQDGVLMKVDRASMQSSLEVRVPMLDHEMVNFANGLAENRKLRGARSKWILREWARRHFPSDLAERPKKGFGAPLARWFRSELRELVRDTLSSAAIARDGFFQSAAIQRILDDHEQGRRDHRKRIFNVLMFTLWHRSYR